MLAGRFRNDRMARTGWEAVVMRDLSANVDLPDVLVYEADRLWCHATQPDDVQAIVADRRFDPYFVTMEADEPFRTSTFVLKFQSVFRGEFPGFGRKLPCQRRTEWKAGRSDRVISITMFSAASGEKEQNSGQQFRMSHPSNLSSPLRTAIGRLQS